MLKFLFTYLYTQIARWIYKLFTGRYPDWFTDQARDTANSSPTSPKSPSSATQPKKENITHIQYDFDLDAEEKEAYAVRVCARFHDIASDYLKKVSGTYTAKQVLDMWSTLFYGSLSIFQEADVEDEMEHMFLLLCYDITGINRNRYETDLAFLERRNFLISKFTAEKLSPNDFAGASRMYSITTAYSAGLDIDPLLLASALDVLRFTEAIREATSYAESLYRTEYQKGFPAAPSVVPISKPHTQSTTPRKSSFETFLLISVCVLIAVILIVLGAQAAARNDPQVLSPTSTTAPTEDPVLSPLELPRNGRTFSTFEGLSTPSTLTVNAGSMHHYIVLSPISLGPNRSEEVKYKDINLSNTLRFFVRANSTARVLVPLGTYKIYYATGYTWYGEEHLFGNNTVYHICSDDFTFKESDWLAISLSSTEDSLLAVDYDYITKDLFPK